MRNRSTGEEGFAANNSGDDGEDIILDEDEQQAVVDGLRDKAKATSRRWLLVFKGVSVLLMVSLVYLFLSDDLESGELKHLVDIFSFPKYSAVNLVFLFVSSLASLLCSLLCLFVSTKFERIVCFACSTCPPMLLFLTSYFMRGTYVCFYLFPILYGAIVLMVSFTLEGAEDGLRELEEMMYKHKKA